MNVKFLVSSSKQRDPQLIHSDIEKAMEEYRVRGDEPEKTLGFAYEDRAGLLMSFDGLADITMRHEIPSRDLCVPEVREALEFVEHCIRQRDVEINMQDPLVGAGVPFERIRRITGYLVGTLDRFNNAKRAEVQDRVKHGEVSAVKIVDTSDMSLAQIDGLIAAANTNIAELIDEGQWRSYSNTSAKVMGELEDIIDLQAMRAKILLNMETSEKVVSDWQTQKEGAEIMHQMGYEKVVINGVTDNFVWEDTVSGQRVLFTNVNELKTYTEHLLNREPAATITFVGADEEKYFYKGQEDAAIQYYAREVHYLGVNAVRYHVAAQAELDDFAYRFYLSEANEYGLGEGDEDILSRTDFITARAETRERTALENENELEY